MEKNAYFSFGNIAWYKIPAMHYSIKVLPGSDYVCLICLYRGHIISTILYLIGPPALQEGTYDFTCFNEYVCVYLCLCVTHFPRKPLYGFFGNFAWSWESRNTEKCTKQIFDKSPSWGWGFAYYGIINILPGYGYGLQ